MKRQMSARSAAAMISRRVDQQQRDRVLDRVRARGTSRGTKLREPELISAHLSVPELLRRDPTERVQGIS